MVDDEGRVKILDFGLAKLRRESPPGEATEAMTETLTGEGHVVGTLPKRSVNRSDGSGKSLRSVIGQSLGVYQPMIKGRGFSAADASVPLADEVAPLPFV